MLFQQATGYQGQALRVGRSQVPEIQTIEADPVKTVHILGNAVQSGCSGNILSGEVRHLCDSLQTDFITAAVVTNQQLCNTVALLGELDALDANILPADQFHALIAMGFILDLGITANVVKQTEIDQDQPVFFRECFAGMLAVNECKNQNSQNMFDAMPLEEILDRVT